MSSAPTSTLWEIGEHTRGKHIVLRRYLQAWIPILGFTQGKVLFIDGFAGPGQYVGGEDGSPIIALKAFEEHYARPRIKAHVLFWFIELENDRARHLETLVAPYRERLGSSVGIDVTTGRFDETLSTTLAEIAADRKVLVPAFVMIDPFGVSQTPMAVIAQILRNPKSETYISFMAESINRFKDDRGWEVHLDGLFGCRDWRQSSDMQNPRERRKFIFDLYKKCLKEAGAKYVVHFELYRGAELVYAIFFATGNELGCDRMKEAIWKADPAGGQSFVPAYESALDLFDQDVSRFEHEILQYLNGRDWVAVHHILAWAKTDRTHYYSGQVKRALKILETTQRIEVDGQSRTRRGSFTDGCLVRVAQPNG